MSSNGSARSARPSRPNVGKAYDLMEIYFRAAVIMNSIPFRYNKRDRQFHHDKSSLKYKVWFVLMLVVICIETAQTTYELVRSKRDPSVARGDCALVYFVFISWILITSCHYNIKKNGHLIVNHLNQSLRMREWFDVFAKLPPSQDHKIVRAHIWSSCCQCFFQCLMVAAEGFKGQYIYSNLPLEYRGVLSAALWAIWAYYRVMTNFLSGYFHYFVGVLHVQTCNQVLELRSRKNVDFARKLKFFRMVQLLCARYKEAHAGIFIPNITLFASQNLILGYYGIVKFYDKMEFQLYANFPLMVLMMTILTGTFYPKNATIYESTKNGYKRMLKMAVDSEDIFQTSSIQWASLRRSVENPFLLKSKEAKCVARSCPTLGVPLGGLYTIKRSTALNIFDFILCNTISALITYP